MKWRLILENELNYDVKIIDDKDVLKQYKKEIFNLIRDAYSDKGGFAGADNPRTLIKDTDRAKIVFDSEGKILACALYLVDLGGYKRFGSAGIHGSGAESQFGKAYGFIQYAKGFSSCFSQNRACLSACLQG